MTRGVRVAQRRAYGPVQLDETATDFAGCLKHSNNTAELSAVPHAMADLLIWRKRMEQRGKLPRRTVVDAVMVYDSEYTRQSTGAAVAALAPRHNQTAVEVGRRLVHEARSSRIRVHWVKVKGHSAHDKKWCSYTVKSFWNPDWDLGWLCSLFIVDCGLPGPLRAHGSFLAEQDRRMLDFSPAHSDRSARRIPHSAGFRSSYSQSQVRLRVDRCMRVDSCGG
jgi:ribonuclease HI